MVEEFLKSIDWNDLSVIGGIVLSILFSRPVFMALIDAFQKRSDAIERQTTVLNGIATRITADESATRVNTQASQALLQSVNALNERFESTADEMRTVSQTTRRAIQAMHDDVKIAPTETWRLGDPKLEQVQVVITQYLEGLEERLIERIPPDATGAIELTRLDITAMKTDILRRLSDIEVQLKRFTPRPKTPEVSASAAKVRDKSTETNAGAGESAAPDAHTQEARNEK